MYCVYGNSSWYINGGPLFGGGPLLGGSVIGGSTVYISVVHLHLKYTVADPGGVPRVPRNPPFLIHNSMLL